MLRLFLVFFHRKRDPYDRSNTIDLDCTIWYRMVRYDEGGATGVTQCSLLIGGHVAILAKPHMQVGIRLVMETLTWSGCTILNHSELYHSGHQIVVMRFCPEWLLESTETQSSEHNSIWHILEATNRLITLHLFCNFSCAWLFRLKNTGVKVMRS